MLTTPILAGYAELSAPGAVADLDADLFPWTKLAERLCKHPALSEFINNVTGVASDLDNTLVDSSPAWHNLNLLIAAELGIDAEPQLLDMHTENRGVPFEDYLNAFHGTCSEHHHGTLGFDEFQQVRAGVIERVTSPDGGIRLEVPQIPDSMPLVHILTQQLRLNFKVTTHANRSMAEMFLRNTGFAEYASNSTLTCGDDTPLGKDDPRYWKKLIGEEASSGWFGLDDTPSGARWMLEKGNLGFVIARSSNPDYADDFGALKMEFQERLIMVEEFGELFGSQQ